MIFSSIAYEWLESKRKNGAGGIVCGVFYHTQYECATNPVRFGGGDGGGCAGDDKQVPL